jgi:hypothetical protein
MSWIDHIISLPNPLNLASFFVGQIFSDGLLLMLIDVILILTIHGAYIFLLTRLFRRCVVDTSVGKSTKASLLFYLLMILLVIFSHIGDIFVLTLALESMKVFPDPLTTFHYVSGMYTTIGSSYSPGHDWQGLSMLISFTGLFAFSISGSGLFTMLSYFIESGNSNMKAKS